MNPRQEASLVNSTARATQAVNQVSNANRQMMAGAANLNMGRVGPANTNARNATSQLSSASTNFKKAANGLASYSNLNKNIAIASNYLNRASAEAAKAATAKSLVLAGKAAEALGKAAGSNSMNNNSRLRALKSRV